MTRQESEKQSDELIADSLQVENYLKQSRNSRLHTVHLGTEQGINSYLKRYQKASPQVKFRVFLFSSFYARKIELFLEDWRGDRYA